MSSIAKHLYVPASLAVKFFIISFGTEHRFVLILLPSNHLIRTFFVFSAKNFEFLYQMVLHVVSGVKTAWHVRLTSEPIMTSWSDRVPSNLILPVVFSP